MITIGQHTDNCIWYGLTSGAVGTAGMAMGIFLSGWFFFLVLVGFLMLCCFMSRAHDDIMKLNRLR